MMLDADQCYQALISHDVRFDGRFFVAVASTGIYCRPICTSRPARRRNCGFFPSAAAAERAGFRPCLRCRPELGPGLAAIDATRRLAQAAAHAIEDGCLADQSLAQLAQRLGVTDRHLRRVFHAEFGVAPIDYWQTQRMLLAKRLLRDTNLPITSVAFAAGFGSTRRFHAAMRQRYQLAPVELRGRASAKDPSLHFMLAYRPPYAWHEMLEFLGARAIAGVESVAGGAYRRAVVLSCGGEQFRGWIEVTRAQRSEALCLQVAASLAPVICQVLRRVRQLFDLYAAPADIEMRLGKLALVPGLRVPGAFDGFEVAVRAILGQQISVAAARVLAGRFAAAFGTGIDTPFDQVTTVFPAATQITNQTSDSIARLGVVPSRAEALWHLAAACAAGRVQLNPEAELETQLQRLRSLPGVGEWTAQYIAMRALAWPDAFPHTDLGIKKALGVTQPRRVLDAAEGWRPWRAYATMQLWRSLTA
jgi:AraC family transcriptional regulator of adaptative response / DNA-3-methyladenine glycosylase II